jgi:hypothetical protein
MARDRIKPRKIKGLMGVRVHRPMERYIIGLAVGMAKANTVANSNETTAIF